MWKGSARSRGRTTPSSSSAKRLYTDQYRSWGPAASVWLRKSERSRTPSGRAGDRIAEQVARDRASARAITLGAKNKAARDARYAARKARPRR